MKITSETKDDRIFVITVSGRVMGSDSLKMRDEIKKLIGGLPEGQPPKLILNLSGVSMDCAGLGVLVSLDMTVKKRQGKIALAELNPGLTNLLAITNLARVFDVYNKTEDAIAAFNEKPVPA